MTVRIVPLRSAEASEPPAPAAVAERLALVDALSEALWRQSGRALPSAARAQMPGTLRPDMVAQFGLPPFGDLPAVPFIGRDAFVRNKRASGRSRDLADLDSLGEG